MISRWLTKLVPAQLKEAARVAEDEAADSRTVMEAVEAQEATVQHLAARMEIDRIENHYAQRVAAAMGRTHP